MAKPKKEKVDQDLEAAPVLSLKQRAQDIKNKFNKEKGRVLIQTYNDDDDITIKRTSSGVLKLDRILGQGSNGWGWAKGRMHGIHGPESAGKTSVILSTIANFQKEGRLAVLVDAECSYSPSYAEVLGVNIDELLVINPSYAEEAYDSIESLIKTGDVSLVVIDSLNGLLAKVIVESSAEDKFMGTNAAINDRFFTKVQNMLLEHDCTLIIVSQIREKVGVVYGSSETVSGGRALKFYASTRIEIRKDEDVKENGDAIGHITKFKSVKNKTASPQQVTYSRIDWGKGFNKYYDLIDLAIKDGIIQKAGAGWLTYKDRKIQGENNFTKELESNEQMYNDILEKLGMN